LTPDTFAEELEDSGVDQFNESESVDVDLGEPATSQTSTLKQLLTAESPRKQLGAYEGHPMDMGEDSFRHMLRGFEGRLQEVTDIDSTRLALLDLFTGVFKLFTGGGGGADASNGAIPTGE